MPRTYKRKLTKVANDNVGPFFGLHETAQYLGVRPQTIYQWMTRGRIRTLPMPAPIQHLHMGPLWRRMDIVTYKRTLDERKRVKL